jgi:beta-1,4-mannosyl-glycoprotein beta-1,4-N-acetylglucosaminyltransferase
MAEWLKAPAWKACILSKVSRVRIPFSPPSNFMKKKIFDCITFFRENFQFDLRFNILNDYVDYFVICEARRDHQGKKKKLNFNIKKYSSFKKKIIYLVCNDFPSNLNPWQRQAYQREFILNGLNKAKPDDYIIFSDPDEIPRPEKLININLEKKYGIFLQNSYCYKFNIFNQYESPWEGSRICQKKDLHSVNYLRQKILTKNLRYSFFRIDKEKSIKIINDGGWHFNSLMSAKEISLKLKTFAHNEFGSKRFSSVNIISAKIKNKEDLFQRGHKYKKVSLNRTFPFYVLKNIYRFKKFIER